MQNMIYDLAPYDILYYDSNLDAYRTDKFTGLQNMPANGVPLFTYGTFNYTQLKDATAVPTPAPTSAASVAPGTSSAPATPAPSAAPGNTSSGGSNTTLLIILLVVVIVVVALAWWYRGRRKAAAVDEEG
jgi:hypothetical protein